MSSPVTEAAPTRRVVTLQEMRDLVGKSIGVSPWVLIDQERIDAFAEVTEDHQFIHVDPERAAKAGPFGGTIAHGFLTLSLLVRMAELSVPLLEDDPPVINFGLDKIRWLVPVKAGQRIRARFTLAEMNEKTPGRLLFRHSVTVEIEGEDRAALVAHWLTAAVTDTAAKA